MVKELNRRETKLAVAKCVFPGVLGGVAVQALAAAVMGTRGVEHMETWFGEVLCHLGDLPASVRETNAEDAASGLGRFCDREM